MPRAPPRKLQPTRRGRCTGRTESSAPTTPCPEKAKLQDRVPSPRRQTCPVPHVTPMSLPRPVRTLAVAIRNPRPKRLPCVRGSGTAKPGLRGRPPRTPCPVNASGGSLSFTSERKGGKNAAKTNGFGILARAQCGKYRDLLSPRITLCKPVSCFRTVSGSIHRDALRACAARPNRENPCVYRFRGVEDAAPYEILSSNAA